MCRDGALQAAVWREVEGTTQCGGNCRGGEEDSSSLQFPILWLPPCAWEGGLAAARDTRPLQVLEATPPGILRLVTRHK